MDFHQEQWQDFIGPHSEARSESDALVKFMNKVDLDLALKATGARLSADETREVLGLDQYTVSEQHAVELSKRRGVPEQDAADWDIWFSSEARDCPTSGPGCYKRRSDGSLVKVK